VCQDVLGDNTLGCKVVWRGKDGELWHTYNHLYIRVTADFFRRRNHMQTSIDKYEIRDTKYESHYYPGFIKTNRYSILNLAC
jgi:hypothetical protein